MIELTFGDSAAGALKFAKSMRHGQAITGAVGVIGGTKKDARKCKKPRIWLGATMEGRPRDVAPLSLLLDMGDVSDCPGGMQSRARMLHQLYNEFPGVSGQLIATNKQTFARLEQARADLEPIRLWVCDASPEELCGLYFICNLMQQHPVPLLLVRVPAQIEREDCLIHYRSTGDIPPMELGELSYTAKTISPAMRTVYAQLWAGLTQENAPLRAIVNGTLMGVCEEFYDFALRAHIPDGDFAMARLLGAVLGRLPGVSDRWLRLRIEQLLLRGELVEVAPATQDHPYSAILRRAAE